MCSPQLHCLPLPSRPADCSEGLDKCSFCGDGYGLVAGKCVKCADPKCQSCPDDASKCLSCVFVEGSPPMGIDLKTGACTACPDKCSACSDDAATCAFWCGLRVPLLA